MKLTYDRTEELLRNIRGCKVAVLGDVMLDEYLFGEVTRISPEAPVPIIKVTKENAVLGGAANVAANLKAIGAEPFLVGTISDDTAGSKVLQILKSQGIATDYLVFSDNPTIIKTRIIGHNQQMLRIDREETDFRDIMVTTKLKSNLRTALNDASSLIISDYAKGVASFETMREAQTICKQRLIPCIVDPKPKHKEFYGGVDFMTPNLGEAKELSGHPCNTNEEIELAGFFIMNDLDLDGLLLTLSEKGMVLFTKDATNPRWIPTAAQAVFDVSGAGDTVIATFTAAIGAGASWEESALLANVAAGIVVGKVGTATASPNEILDHYHTEA